MAKKYKIKSDLDVTDDNKLHLDIDLTGFEDVGVEGPDEGKKKDEIHIVQTNPCTWIKIGGTWRRICWGS
jgi:hypothetical protein